MSQGRSTVTGYQSSVVLPVEISERLDVIAGKRGTKRTTLIREAILFWLDHQDTTAIAKAAAS